MNLAVTLAQQGKSVGLLDGDIFGPSIPLMMNLDESPLVDDRNQMIPLQNYGVKWLVGEKSGGDWCCRTLVFLEIADI